jgi:HlyD family secretion protein
MKNNMQWRRRIVLGLLAALAVWGLFLGFRPQALEVDMGAASRADLRVVLEQEGRTRVLDRYVLAAPVTGYARRVKLEVGDAVERGATLVELEPVRADVLDPRRRAEAQARIAACEAGVGAAEQRASAAASTADLAQTELQRMHALRLQGHVSVAAEDSAGSEARRSAADLGAICGCQRAPRT